MLSRLTQRPEWRFFSALAEAGGAAAWAWWAVLLARGVLPAAFAIAMGRLIADVQRAAPLGLPLAATGAIFAAMQILPPLHKALSQAAGTRAAGSFYGQLAATCLAPDGIAHLEDPRFAGDLSMASDFDLGLTGPPLAISMDFIASGLGESVGGIAAALVLFAYAWWAPPVLAGAWFMTHRLLRESAVWKDRNTDEVRSAQRHADYAYRLAVEPPAAKELRLFGLEDWVVERFSKNRVHLLDLQWQATRLRERPVLWSLLITLAANLAVFLAIAHDFQRGTLTLAAAVTFVSAATAAGMLAFGGLSWALDSAAAPARAIARLREQMLGEGALSSGAQTAAPTPAREIRFRDVRFGYPRGETVLDGFNLTIPAGSSMAIVGVNGAGKTTIAKLLCRLYDPQAGSIEADGVDLRSVPIEAWRARLAAVFQDFIHFELPLRGNVAPAGAPDAAVEQALADAGAAALAPLGTILAKGYQGGIDLSGGQWQRVALARALCAVSQGAAVVLLDEPTAQLDVRGEAEIFERILRATRHTTTILISHRFSTVRHADRICVLEHGKLVELGSHDELIAAGGRYQTMFELQASRFEETSEGTPLE